MLATMDWVQWYNEDRIHSYSGDMPPKKYEEIYYQALETGKLTSSSQTSRPPNSPGRTSQRLLQLIRHPAKPPARGDSPGSRRASAFCQWVRVTRASAGLRSGDGPLSVRVRPSSLKRDCDRRATSTGGKCLVDVHAKSRLMLEPLRTLRSEDKGQAGACPDRTRAIPCTVRAVTGRFHDPEYTRNDLGGPRDERSSPGRQAGRCANSLDCRGGLRSRVRRFESCRGYPAGASPYLGFTPPCRGTPDEQSIAGCPADSEQAALQPRKHHRQEDLHTICARTASLLHTRVLRCGVTRAKACGQRWHGSAAANRCSLWRANSYERWPSLYLASAG